MDRKFSEDDIYYENDLGDEGLNIDFKRYIQVVFKRKWIILAIFIIVTLPWFYHLKKQPPVYEASCRIRFRNAAAGTQNVIDDSRIIELTSRSFAERVVAQLGLALVLDHAKGIERQHIFSEFHTTDSVRHGNYILRWEKDGTYTIHRRVGEAEELVDKGYIMDAISTLRETPNKFSFKLDPNVTSLPHEIEFSIKKFRRAVQEFQQNTHVRRTGGGGILQLTMTDKNPILVAQKVNRLAEVFVNESKTMRRSAIETRKRTIQEQLAVSERELEKTDQELKAFKSRHKVSLNAETNEVVRDLAKIEDQLASYEKQRIDLADLLRKVEAYQGDFEDATMKYVYQELTELATFANNPNMGILQKQLNDLLREYDRITSTFTDSHEEAIKLKSQIREVQYRVKSEARAHLADLENRIAEMTREKNTLEYKIKRLPEEQQQLTELERQLKAKENLYAELLAKAQLVKLTDEVETEYVDILDPAIVPETPMNRDKKKKAMMGAVFALMLGLGVSFTLEFLDKAIKTVDDVKRYLKLQVLGTIPNINFKDISDYQDSEKIKQIDQQLVTYDYSPTPIGEAYRSLRTNLVYSKNTGRVQSIVLTSAAPGDGKSFTSANVAISLAQHKSNTLLIDADLRRGVLHNTFGVPKEPGLTNYLTGMVSFQHLINDTLIPNLSLVSCGSLLPNPSELLGSHQMQRFLDEAKRKYDMIIFDSPPLNAATDAIVLGTQVDALVLVIRSGVTDRDIAKQKLELFKNVPVRILGAILNGTTSEFGHDGYSYYHY